MKRFALWLCIILAPFLLMVGVNELSPAPSHGYHPENCSRYCHDHGCPHHRGLQFLDTSPSEGPSWQVQLYWANIQALKHNPFGLSYASMNLLVYVIFLPGLMALLLWGLVRRRRNG